MQELGAQQESDGMAAGLGPACPHLVVIIIIVILVCGSLGSGSRRRSSGRSHGGGGGLAGDSYTGASARKAE